MREREREREPEKENERERHTHRETERQRDREREREREKEREKSGKCREMVDNDAGCQDLVQLSMCLPSVPPRRLVHGAHATRRARAGRAGCPLRRRPQPQPRRGSAAAGGERGGASGQRLPVPGSPVCTPPRHPPARRPPRPVPVFSCPRRARSAALPRQPQPRRGSAAAGGERGRADSGSPCPVPPCTPSPRLLLPRPPANFVRAMYVFFYFLRPSKMVPHGPTDKPGCTGCPHGPDCPGVRGPRSGVPS